MSKTTITLTNTFADGAKRELVIGPFNTSSIHLSSIRAAVKSLNDDSSTISTLYLSDDGANFSEVSQVKIVNSDQTIIV